MKQFKKLRIRIEYIEQPDGQTLLTCDIKGAKQFTPEEIQNTINKAKRDWFAQNGVLPISKPKLITNPKDVN